ncbi:MAG: DUF169 domain-containing protein [Methanomassiliicoccales archaeon]|nr:DUF169 domain-containing protein [Methanomassiliicoccales archaeon]
MSLTVAEISKGLARAGMLTTEPICVHGAERPEEGWVTTGKVDRCLMKVLLKLSLHGGPPAYVGEGATEGCCGGGLAYMGYSGFSERIRYFVSVGRPDGTGGAEYLKRTPELVDAMQAAAGKIVPLGKHTVFRRCSSVTGEAPEVKSFVCFGTAESIRVLCALNSFGTADTFGSAIMPAGSACASLVTYPSGISSKAPKGCVYLGPTDPTVDSFFPESFLGLAIPRKVAERMVMDIEASFVAKRTKVAYPEKREKV